MEEKVKENKFKCGSTYLIIEVRTRDSDYTHTYIDDVEINVCSYSFTCFSVFM